jgi:hypothetical protein
VAGSAKATADAGVVGSGKATNAREAGAAEVAPGVVEAADAGEATGGEVATGDRDPSGSRVPGARGGGGEE